MIRCWRPTGAVRYWSRGIRGRGEIGDGELTGGLEVCSFANYFLAQLGYCEPCNLYVAVLLKPGNRKTAVFKDATAPLRKVEKKQVEARRADVARAASRRRTDEKTRDALEKKAAGGDEEASHEAEELSAELEQRPIPSLPRLMVDDATSEKL